MRNGLAQIGAWAVATGAAVALSWYGVHAVLADAASEHPRAVPLPSAPATPVPDPPSPVSDEPSVTVTAEDPSSSPSPSPGSGGASSPSPARTQQRQPPSPSSVHSYLVPGGRVALDIHPDRADLVSATPDAGWQMQVWNGDHWMRIDFTRDGSANSVFVTWNGHPPDVQTVVR